MASRKEAHCEDFIPWTCSIMSKAWVCVQNQTFFSTFEKAKDIVCEHIGESAKHDPISTDRNKTCLYSGLFQEYQAEPMTFLLKFWRSQIHPCYHVSSRRKLRINLLSFMLVSMILFNIFPLLTSRHLLYLILSFFLSFFLFHWRNNCSSFQIP